MANPHPKTERTFVIVKPDGVQRSLVGEITKRFERTGLKLVALKFTIADEKKLWAHYNKDDAWFERKGAGIIEVRKNMGLPIEKEAPEYGKDIIKVLVQYMMAGPVVMMVWEGNEAMSVIKKIVGDTAPANSDVGTIRGDFTTDSYAVANLDDRAVRNLIHCSDGTEDAQREIGLWFAPEDLVNYKVVGEKILYDVNLDGILE